MNRTEKFIQEVYNLVGEYFSDRIPTPYEIETIEDSFNEILNSWEEAEL